MKNQGVADLAGRAISTGNLVSLSEQQFLDCDTTESACNGGLMDDAVAFAKKNAICTESSCCSSMDQRYTLVFELHRGASGSVTVFKDVTVGVEALLGALVQQPVSVAIDVDRVFFQLSSGGVMTGSGTWQLGPLEGRESWVSPVISGWRGARVVPTSASFSCIQW